MKPISRLIITILPFLCLPVAVPQAQAVVPPPDGGYPGFTTAEGQKALFSLTTGSANTAVGWFSLFSDTEGSSNTGLGAGTLALNTGDNNTATGAAALLLNTTGTNNTANGAFALFNNTIGGSNTAMGNQALFSNTVGGGNTAIGVAALALNIDGGGNTATGIDALASNNNGFHNTASGFQALVGNISGSFNTAIGDTALVGNSTGSNNIALGFQAGSGVTTADNVIVIGANVAAANVSNTCFIGNIRDVQTQNANAIPVLIDSAGQLGTASSSARFKKEIKPMDKASEAVLALQPVTFHYKSDKTNMPQFGLIAEEVADVNPDLVVRDANGEIYTVRYEAVNAMLLNEFLKEHSKVQEQQATITQLESIVAHQKKDLQATVAQLTARLDEQAAQIQKVSAQLAAASPSRGGLEASKFATGRIRGGGPAPQVVNNP